MGKNVRRIDRRSATALLLAAALPPAAGVAEAQGTATQGTAMKDKPPTASTRAYMAAADQTHIDMAIRYSGKADDDFAAVMAAHHQGAIAMAKVELQYGTDPEMRKLAQAIVTAQENDIAVMQAWAAKHR